MYKSPYSVSIVEKVAKEAAEEFDGLVMKVTVDANITVDRDELLKALAYDRGQYDKGYGDGYQDGKRDALEWISVEDRCPEKYGDYLVFDDCRNLYVNEWHCLLHKWQYDDGRITHWAQLPEPPKEVESDG